MRLTIQSKLLASFAVVVALMLVVGLFAVMRLGSDNRHLGLLATRVVPSTRAVGDINALMNKYRKDQLHYIVARPADRPLGVDGSIAGDLDGDLSLMRSSLRDYQSNGLVEDAQDRQLFGAFRRSFSGYVRITSGFRQLADQGKTFGAAAVVGDGAGDAQWDKLKTLIASWNNHKVATASVEQGASHKSYRFGVILIALLLAAAVSIAVGVAVVMTTSLRRLIAENECLLAASREEAAVQAAQNEQLRELDQMKDEFVALVSHELRTPLTAIQGYTELVLDGTAGEVNDDQRMMLTAVDRNSTRLFRLINDLLFMAQVNAGKLSVAIEDVDLATVAAEAVTDARPRAEAAEVTLALECEPLPLVRADRARLAQVFDNLISNAIKFTPAGGRVGLSVAMVGEEVVIVVADSGMGMTAEDQQRLFTRFFRTKEAGKIQGTGLGLSITKAILDAHHGSISVESEPGHGTRFIVTVPARDAPLVPAPSV